MRNSGKTARHALRATALALLVCAAVFFAAGCQREEPAEEEHWDAKPSVMIDGVLYGTTGRYAIYRTKERPENGGHADGEITSSTEGWKYPAENSQANFGTGMPWRYGAAGTVEVYAPDDGRWYIYEAYTDQPAPAAKPDEAGGIHTELTALPALTDEPRQSAAAEKYFAQARDETVPESVFGTADGGVELIYGGENDAFYQQMFADFPQLTAGALYLAEADAETVRGIWLLADEAAAGEYGRTLHDIYYLTADRKVLMQLDPETGARSAVYRSSLALGTLRCGRAVVVFAEQTPDGAWRTLRLYEPDGSVAVLETDLPAQPQLLTIINSCETVCQWENPEYTRLADEHGEAYWQQLWTSAAQTPPYTDEEIDKTDFRMQLAFRLYHEYGAVRGYLRWRSTLTDETVTVGYAYIDTDQESYILSDGSVWAPHEQALNEQRQYAGIRFSFWKYLTPDEA